MNLDLLSRNLPGSGRANRGKMWKRRHLLRRRLMSSSEVLVSAPSSPIAISSDGSGHSSPRCSHANLSLAHALGSQLTSSSASNSSNSSSLTRSIARTDTPCVERNIIKYNYNLCKKRVSNKSESNAKKIIYCSFK